MIEVPVKIENAKIEDYQKYLKEKSRPPSRGGNTKSLHAHILVIDGKQYSFLALGSQQWVFKTDLVSFEYELDGQYRNVDKETLVTTDKSGNKVVRGNRGFKRQLRTADARMPVSRREMNS
ncbi:hypothetical protein FQP89_19490 [Vreelandella titanicae]|uniref:Uncharacterized protein n=1 Tax=Vreelandella titanicae TaxID=664683 RepID=A0A558J265_9GAMM|nr:hypothetical protein FQP89_19490 [Halomonas titanicae]